jgi:hypothetical protein
MSFYAYIHCKPDGTPFYVGKGNENRIKRIKRVSNPHHTNIVNKYGIENILVGKMECSTEAISLSLERGLIKRLKIMGFDIANLTDGGEGVSGLVMSENAKEKMRLAKVGKKLSKEHIEKIRNSNTGRSISEESRKKLSLSRLGIVFSDDHKSKLRAAKIGIKFSDEHRKNLSAAIAGRYWITNGVGSKMIKANDVIPDGWRRGRASWGKA